MKQSALNKHLASRHFQQCFKCDYKDCPKIFVARHLLYQHLRVFHKKGLNKGLKRCPQCHVYMPNVEAHSRVFHRFPCTICSMSFVRSHQLLFHLRKHHADLNNECCGQVFTKAKRFIAHLKLEKVHLTPTQQKLRDDKFQRFPKCLFCHKLDANLNVFQLCLKCTLKINPIVVVARFDDVKGLKKCKECQETDLELHKNQCHSDAKTKRDLLKCEKCDKNFTFARSLSHHLAIDHAQEEAETIMTKADKPKDLEPEPTQAPNEIPQEEIGGLEKDQANGNESRKQTATCKVCHKTLHKNSMSNHMMRKHGLFFNCPSCESYFKTHQDWTTHQTKEHSQDSLEDNSDLGLVKCECCDVNFETVAKVKNHRRKIELQKRKQKLLERHRNYKRTLLSCRQCFKIFYTLKALKRHTKLSHKSKIYQCFKCDKVLIDIQSFAFHMHGHRAKSREPKKSSVSILPKLWCHHCHARFLDSSSFQDHLKSKHSSPQAKSQTERGQCQICSKVFYTKGSMLPHLKEAHGFPDKKCLICGKEFTRDDSVVRHLRNVHCDEDFSSYLSPPQQEEMAKPITEEIRPKVLQVFSCTFCAFSTSEQASILTHMMTAHISVQNVLLSQFDEYTEIDLHV